METIEALQKKIESAQRKTAELESAAERHKQTDAALRHANETLRALIEASPIAIMNLDSRGRVLLWNKAAERMFGWTEQEVLGRFNPIVPEDCREEFEKIREMAMKGPITGIEIRRRKKDGSPIELSLSTAGVSGPGGAIASYIGMFTDITIRKKNEESLRLFRDLMNQSNDAIFVIDPETALILDVNDMACSGLGYGREEMLRMKVPDFEVKIPDMASWRYHLAELRQKGSGFFEGIQRRKDGATFAVEVNGKYIRHETRDYILSVVRDVTERKRMEEIISQSRQDWEEVFDTITDMITLHDAEFNIIRANKAASRVLSLPCITNTRPKCYRVYHGGGESPIGECPACRALMTGEPATITRFEPALNMFIEIRAIPRFDKDKRLTGIIHVVRDVTESKRVEQELEQYRTGLEELVKERTGALREANEKMKLYSEELEKSNRELEQFAYMASHDLQEPILAIASYLKLFQRHNRGKLDPETGEFVEGAIESTIRMQTFIRGLLAYSTVGTREIALMEIDTAGSLAAALASLAHQIEKTGAHITHDPMPVLQTDPSQLPHVFQNLIGNALKFHGAQPPRIHVSASRETRPGGKDVWVFSVSDNGIGIAAEEKEHIFQIFHRGGKRQPGAGIGLATCKKIIERLGGRIWVESEAGKGSTFYFELPAG
ncbi:MAG: PAS domain S-box protein [Nitrospiraceae bacterium]|nr:PAS domain S-box protein [Nitrospiraceae bacterium]